MFNEIKKRDLAVIFALLLFTVVFGYYYVNSLARNKLWVKTYPIRAQLSAGNIHCSAGSPDWLAEMLRHQTKNNNAPANQIAYISADGKLSHCQNGYQGQLPIISGALTEQSRYRFASVTKLWTADAILQLIKDGKLDLDTKLAAVLSEIDAPKDARVADMTIGQLLTHRAGFDRYSVFGNDMFGIGKDICPNHLSALNDIELGFDPDSKTSYSNLGYCLLGEVISRLNDNTPYKDVIAKQYHFDDTSLQFISNQALPDEVAYNYVETGLTGYADIYTAFDYDGLASAAGLSGNAIDLARQVRQMAKKPEPNITTIDEGIGCDVTKMTECYGLAMMPYQPKLGAPFVYYRDGALLGLSTLVAVDDKGGVVALLSNGSPSHGKDKEMTKKLLYSFMTEP